jgi:UDP-galactopyranose mutase
MSRNKHICIVGAGFAGSVLARALADMGGYTIEVLEERDHVAGNCHTYRDTDTGIMIHAYGPHIFNTSRKDVWDYITSWGRFGAYTNRVKAVTTRGVFSLPLNLLTINQFFQKRFTPEEARVFVASLGDTSIGEPANFEEQAMKMMGRELYENFFKGYTTKQWGVDPSHLPASILKRLPIRFNYDDNYYDQQYQGIPVDGYTAIVERILDHPSIRVTLNTRFERAAAAEYDHVFFSGPVDQWYARQEGPLRYRSLVFERSQGIGDHQGNPVINYCDKDVPYTRVAEHKHFAPWEKHEGTVWFREFSKATTDADVPYYPMRLDKDKDVLTAYADLLKGENAVTFIGRLGTYRYLDMHVVIGESLDLAEQIHKIGNDTRKWPRSSAPLVAPAVSVRERVAV